MTTVNSLLNDSGTIKALTASGKIDDEMFVFGENPGAPKHQVQIYRDTKVVANAVNSQVFDLMPNGILRSLHLEFAITVGADQVTLPDGILRMILAARLLSDGIPIMTLHRQGIRAWIDAQDADIQAKYAYGIPEAAGTIANGTTATYVIPLCFDFCNGNPNKYLDLTFISKLQLQVDFTQWAQHTHTSSAANITALGATLVSEYVQLDPEAHKQYIAKNFPAGKPVTFLVKDMQIDQSGYALPNTAVSVEVPLTAKVPATQTVLEVRLAGNAKTGITAARVAAANNWGAVQVNGNGAILLDIRSVLYYMVKSKRYGTPSTGAFPTYLVIDWQMSELGDMFNGFAGALVMNSLNGASVTITPPVAFSADYTLNVVHIYQKYMQIDTASGKMSVAVGN